jgi:hypothetical protein
MNMLLPIVTVLLAMTGTTTGATEPTTRAAPDLSSPTAAAEALRSAVTAGDAVAIREVIHAPDAPSRALADAHARVIAAGKRLADACAAEFGAAGDAIGLGAAGLSEPVRSIEPGRIKVSGEEAHLLLHGRDDRVMIFRRQSDGRWRFDLLEFIGAQRGENVARQARMLRSIANGLEDVAEGVAAHRYRTPADVKAAVQDRFHGAVARSLDAVSRPTTATAPTTEPVR